MRALLVVIALLAIGCAGSPPPSPTYYLLPVSDSEGMRETKPEVLIGLGRIEVSPYLRQQGLVVETEPGQVRPASYHLWAEPLQVGLRGFLRQEISTALGFDIGTNTTEYTGWDYRVDLTLERLHGTLSGQAQIVARWVVRTSTDIESATGYRFAKVGALPREGYAALVAAEIDLTRQLARAIADSLRDLAEPPS